MPKSDRLFRLLNAFRMLPQPVTAARLAEETGYRNARFTATSRPCARRVR
jgi:predicted DNA-binding transcriptional regulator YafY